MGPYGITGEFCDVIGGTNRVAGTRSERDPIIPLSVIYLSKIRGTIEKATKYGLIPMQKCTYRMPKKDSDYLTSIAIPHGFNSLESGNIGCQNYAKTNISGGKTVFGQNLKA